MSIIINELKKMKKYETILYKIGLLKLEILNDYNKIRFIDLGNKLNETFNQLSEDINDFKFLKEEETDLSKYANYDISEILKENKVLNGIELTDLFDMFNISIKESDLVESDSIENFDFIILENGVLLKYLYFGDLMQVLLFEEDLLLIDLYNDINELTVKNLLLNNLLNLKNEKFDLFFENILKF